MTRGVEDVDLVGSGIGTFGGIVKLHDGGGDGDTALLLYVHPVGCGGLLDFVVFYGTGYLYLSTEKEEFLGEGGLAGIRVGDDGECATAGYFGVHIKDPPPTPPMEGGEWDGVEN